MDIKMFMSPRLGRRSLSGSPAVGRKRNVFSREDENHLLQSPTDCEANEIINGNVIIEKNAPSSTTTQFGGPSSLPSQYHTPEVGFSFPNKLKTPVSQVVQSLKEKSQNKNYSELGSCPSLNSGRRPLLARNVGCSSSGDILGDDAAIFGTGQDTGAVEEFVQTAKGKILVARQGDPKKPIIITYHDIGLNYLSNFQAFFNSGAMASVLDSFCIYHVTAPGQESGAKNLPDDFVYPNMDELSEQVEYVLHYFGIAHCVGFGVGMGANVLVRLARRRPTMIDGLILINCNSQNAGWVEWVYHKVNIKSLKKLQQQQEQLQIHERNEENDAMETRNNRITGGLPDTVVDYLIWYHLGRPDSDGRPLEAVSIASIYRQYFSSSTDVASAKNLSMLLQAYMARTDLGLAREMASNGKPMFGASRTLKMPVINMTGDQSPHVDATVVFNGRLQPNRCTWMKIQDAAMILEEQPAKVGEAVKLFLQGLGYTLRKVGQASTNRSQRSSSVTTTPYSNSTLTGENFLISKVAIHEKDSNVIDNTKNEEIHSQMTDNLMPENSLLDTANTNSNFNLTNNDSINKSPSMDEPSNSVLLAGLEDLSVNNSAFGSNISQN